MTQWGLDTLFNPAKRHMDEEKRRLQSTREEVGDNSGGKRIDFEAGKVKIQKRETSDDAESDETAAGSGSTTSDTGSKAAKPSNTGKSDAGKSDAGKSDAGKSDAGKSDAAKSGAAKSGAGRSDAGKSGTQTLSAAAIRARERRARKAT